ncbi:bifunctional hydroxymethylpyrimidine kinase/phosphomethylpyrimidine kinase [Jeotgalibacillus sp. R-1-5s-1]|uniref:bifunctional hydroxymethylpyrimidine kinase/phosphomethylpyrimidine kinase n=1 Tax=Jeotgalibacillus sp. R-1-5s-1 TaxID=2555897 RepID=UPI00106A7BF4|nr:bifunctional hydroxymethylpyrimidine kinase/phosphomethylpyrimidine kinase [Jeotgalibacillus sp. R-1-5s-1]TFE00035.1 bifunctional hydroxymethylpyrimidine kinase/phosphomethylpyrimidine kinase [Jeotgalibacillus sp. R-1-5s-1]
MNNIPCTLTIAGTDPSGGAGVQADLKTFQEFRTYGMSVITSVVAQNTTGVQDVHHVPVNMLEKQLDSVFSDIPPHALKTGMISDKERMDVIRDRLKKRSCHYVMDPVMVTTSGHPLIEEQAISYLIEELLPLTDLVTPNIPEAEKMIGRKITDHEDMKQAAMELVTTFGAGAVLMKGGHMEGQAVDYLYDGDSMYVFTAPRINTSNTHGTGCTYSAAITSLLAKGVALPEAVESAKKYVTAAIRESFSLGHGNGPTNHWATREGVRAHEINHR